MPIQKKKKLMHPDQYVQTSKPTLIFLIKKWPLNINQSVLCAPLKNFIVVLYYAVMLTAVQSYYASKLLGHLLFKKDVIDTYKPRETLE